MKKYIIRNADGSEQDVMPAVHNTRKEAVKTLMDYFNDNNEDLDFDDDRYFSPFDFTLGEVECKEVNEIVTDFESAKQIVGSTLFIFAEELVNLQIAEINLNHVEALNALNQLFTIAEAWNKEDGFVPDFSDWNQGKWFPWFKYDEDAAGFVYAYTCRTPTAAGANFGSRLCFKSSARAAQFGNQFADLYNKVFL